MNPGTDRSARPDVRNPLLADKDVIAEWLALRAYHPEAAAALQRMLRKLAKRWRGQAIETWENNKAPMGRYQRRNADVALDLAVVMKASSVYARHLAVAGDHATPCGKVCSGHPCTLPKGCGCPDCTVSLHDFPEGS